MNRSSNPSEVLQDLLKVAETKTSAANPKVLYHATYDVHLDSILREGLRGQHWKTKESVVYLSDDPDIAESYVLDSGTAPENAEVVLLVVDAEQLAPDHLELLETFDYGEDDLHTYSYFGDIPPAALKVKV